MSVNNEVAIEEGTEPKLSLFPLVALGIGSMVGAGIFGLPAQVAGKAAPGAMLIGWLITGIGMLFLAFVFQSLASTRPDVTGGVYGYAREGFGDYAGYASAWSYWISAWAGNLSYVVVLIGALSGFPVFKSLMADDTLSNYGLLVGIIVIWIFHFLILSGIRNAAFVNTIVTFVKIIPLLVFIVCAVVAFKVGFFTADFWGATFEYVKDKETITLGSTVNQISNMMLVTVWVFIGIEGAAIYSQRAKKASEVGKATIISFVTVLALLVFVNVLSFGVMAQGDLVKLADPSVAGVMAAAVGDWGAKFINIAVIISVAGAMLTWIMLAAEILYVPADDDNLMKAFRAENKFGSPTVSLWVTNIVSSLFLILMVKCFASSYTDLITIAAGLILPCYVISAFFQVKQSITEDKAVAGAGGSKAWRMLIGIISSVYALWLLWAGGIGLLFLSGLVWLLGSPLYLLGRARTKQGITTKDFVGIGVSAVLAVILFVWLHSFGWNVIDALYWNGLS